MRNTDGTYFWVIARRRDWPQSGQQRDLPLEVTGATEEEIFAKAKALDAKALDGDTQP